MPRQSNSSPQAAPSPPLVLAPPEVDVPLVPPDDVPPDDVPPDDADVELDVEPPGPSPLTVVVHATRRNTSASVHFMEGRLPC